MGGEAAEWFTVRVESAANDFTYDGRQYGVLDPVVGDLVNCAMRLRSMDGLESLYFLKPRLERP